MNRFICYTIVTLALACAPHAQSVLHTWPSPTPQDGGDFGYDADLTGDIDGDGVTDVLVGAPGEVADGAPVASGRAYVISIATGDPIYALDTPEPVSYGAFGHTVASVPDLDGDGRSDFAVGAPREGDVVPRSGRVHVFSSQSGALLYTLQSPNRTTNGNFGVDVAGFTDIDEDGAGDLVIGAWQEKAYLGSGGTDGRAYIVSGATGTLRHDLLSPNPNGTSYFGLNVISPGDLDADGRSDVVISASGEGMSFSGRVYAVSASTGSVLHVTAHGSAYDGYGHHISALEDIDGDAVPDYVVTRQRAAVVISGATGNIVHSLNAPPDHSSYYTADGVGDLDGDGTGDLAVGHSSQREVLSGMGWTPLFDFPYMRIAGIADVTGDDGQEVVVGLTGGTMRPGAIGIIGALPISVSDLSAVASPLQIQPNPTTRRAHLSFALATPRRVRLSVHDVLGREIVVLADGPRTAGGHTVEVDASTWAQGVYVVRLVTEAGIRTTRMTVAQ